MKIIKTLAATIALTVIALACVAQEDDEGPEIFTYASYFYCPGGPLSRVDELVAEDADRMDGFVDDGTILGWGWLAHHTGGQWRRLFYFQADSTDALLDASDAIQDRGDDDEADAEDDDSLSFGAICNRHDDYIWQVESGTIGADRGKAGFSVYHVCDISREERADEIVNDHVAPILDQFVEDGKLTSWGWSSHSVGGRFRRLQTMTAADHKSLLNARNEAIDAIYADDNELGMEFSDICGPHVDYMWNIVHEK